MARLYTDMPLGSFSLTVVYMSWKILDVFILKKKASKPFDVK